MFGVEFVYGEAKQKSSQDQRFGETEQNKKKYWTLIRETASLALIFPVRAGSRVSFNYLSCKEPGHLDWDTNNR